MSRPPSDSNEVPNQFGPSFVDLSQFCDLFPADSISSNPVIYQGGPYGGISPEDLIGANPGDCQGGPYGGISPNGLLLEVDTIGSSPGDYQGGAYGGSPLNSALFEDGWGLGSTPGSAPAEVQFEDYHHQSLEDFYPRAVTNHPQTTTSHNSSFSVNQPTTSTASHFVPAAMETDAEFEADPQGAIANHHAAHPLAEVGPEASPATGAEAPPVTGSLGARSNAMIETMKVLLEQHVESNFDSIQREWNDLIRSGRPLGKVEVPLPSREIEAPEVPVPTPARKGRKTKNRISERDLYKLLLALMW